MPCRHALPISKPSECSANPNSRRWIRPARRSWNAAPPSPALSVKEAALTRAEDAIAALNEQIDALEAARAAEKQAAEQRIEELEHLPASRADAVFGGRRSVGDRPQGFRPPDARGDGAAKGTADGAGRSRTSAASQRRLKSAFETGTARRRAITPGASENIGSYYRASSRVARSSPSSVSGYIRPPIN